MSIEDTMSRQTNMNNGKVLSWPRSIGNRGHCRVKSSATFRNTHNYTKKAEKNSDLH